MLFFLYLNLLHDAIGRLPCRWNEAGHRYRYRQRDWRGHRNVVHGHGHWHVDRDRYWDQRRFGDEFFLYEKGNCNARDLTIHIERDGKNRSDVPFVNRFINDEVLFYMCVYVFVND